ncbi:MAG: DUF2147 domain-containing protein [Flexibacteraceae bacterium]
MKKLFLVLALLLSNFLAFAQAKPDAIIGRWMTADKSVIVEIVKTGEKYVGKIVWGKQKNRKDHKNPDETKRSKYLLNSLILTNFEHKGDNEYSNGEIYDPNSGKTYSSNLELVSHNKLKVQGYVGLTMFGRSSVWTRVVHKKAVPHKTAPKKTVTAKK